MKKLSVFFTMLLVLGVMLTSCDSKNTNMDIDEEDTITAGEETTNNVADNQANTTTNGHPRTYVIDPADVTTTLNISFNSNDQTYQGSVYVWPFLKKDKPVVGDIINLKAKIISNIDIPQLSLCLMDDSKTANYNTELGRNEPLNIKAGVPYEIDANIAIDADCKKSFVIFFEYDGSSDVAKVGKSAILHFEKVADTTNTFAEAGIVIPTGPQIYNVDLGQIETLEIATNHPWKADGTQDTSKISNYQVTPDITDMIGDFLPKSGDTIHLKYKGISNVNIRKIWVRAVDGSIQANWWRELCGLGEAGYVFAENIVANQPFDAEVDIPIVDSPIAQVNLCIWYEVGAAEPDGPAVIKAVK